MEAEISCGKLSEGAVRSLTALAACFPDHPVLMAFNITTVELPGQSDLCRYLGGKDAQAMSTRKLPI